MSDPHAPFGIGPVDEPKLRELLSVQAESDWLDYKSDVDLSTPGGVVELAKDIGAMSMFGGYVVIGAQDNGSPTGRQLLRPALFDMSALGPKLSAFLTGARIASAVHTVGGQQYAIVCVLPHPDGFAIFSSDGQYADPARSGKPKIAFRAGEVYARHHSKSERWQQSDIALIRSRLQRDRASEQAARRRAEENATDLVVELHRHAQAFLVVAVAPTRAGAGPHGAALVEAAEQVARVATESWFSAAEYSWNIAYYGSIADGPRALLTDTRDPTDAGLRDRAELRPDGSGAATVMLGRAERVGEETWTAVLIDRLELQAANLTGLLTGWALRCGASGELHAVIGLYPPDPVEGQAIPVTLTFDHGPTGQRPRPVGRVSARYAADKHSTHHVVVPLRDAGEAPKGAMRLAYELTRAVLNAHGRPEPHLLRPNGTVDTSQALNTWRRVLDLEAEHRGVRFTSPSK